MVKISTEACKFMTGAGSLLDVLNNSVIRLYDGAVPDSADHSIGTSNLLVEIRTGDGNPIMFEMDEQGRAMKSSSETWVGNAIASGRATYYRLVKESDVDGIATTDIRIQGSVGDIGADLTLTNPNITQGAMIPIGSGGYFFPSSS